MSATVHDITTPAPPIVQEVSDGVFAYVQPDGTWWINNTGFLVGRSRAAAIDACATEARTRALVDAIAQVTPAPVQTLVNTHHHGDHTHGNGLFADATIVAHERCREEILAEGKPGTSALIRTGTWTDVDWGDLPVAPPFLTYTTGVDLWVDDLRCEVRHVGTPAHSTNDSIVWIPERRVLFAGDLLFNGGTPFLVAGSVAGAVDAVTALKSLGAETIVPGHGPVCGPEVIDDVLAYLRFVLDLAVLGVRDGTPPLEVARSVDLGRFAALTDQERLVGNLHRAYAELGGAERGAAMDFGSALADMREYNGGAPLTCLA
ncbi:MBL fold metallo-hydrolase [Cryptosporangium sp. NPDC051539]|uniref:MBL fold metallo-hydrolase n=1 Tax=Cryptosporangium sp. NPDC051539 TaxID=3363962 RepID=UPI00379EC1AD